MSLRYRLLREPLVQFLLAGALLYSAYSLFRGPETGPAGTDTIVVDRQTLLAFMQYRANAFESETFAAVLDGTSDAELEQLIDAYVSEEVLYREAAALQLDSSDFVIRQRMVQKMSFLLSDIANSEAIDETALREYFKANSHAYAVAPWVTFTHVYFDRDDSGSAARDEALKTLAELNAAGAGFADAPAYGDRFPFLTNYVERTYEYVASHFGYEFADALAALSANESVWQGPIASALGEHLVLITRQESMRTPLLEEVRSAVELDFAAERSRLAAAEMTDAIRSRYRIDVQNLRSTSE